MSKLKRTRFRDISVSRKNSYIFLCILVATLCCYILVFYSSNKQKSSASLVDVAGKNRMLSQRIAAMSQMVSCAENDSMSAKAKSELKKAIDAHDLALKVLKDGGVIMGVNNDNPLPAEDDPRVLQKIEEVQQYFIEHKRLADILITQPRFTIVSTDSIMLRKPNEAVLEATQVLQGRFLSGALLAHNMEITKLFVDKASQSQKKFIVLLIILMILNIAFIVSGYLLFQKYIAIPLNYLSSISDRISKGDMSVNSEYRSADDVGKISDSINVLTGNLRKAAEFTEKIGMGDFSAELDIQMAEDKGQGANLLVSLVTMKERLKEVSEEDIKRNWATEGLAKFADIFRSNHDLKTFSDMVIRDLLGHLNANQGGLYMLTGPGQDDQYLELISCYAYNRKKYQTKRIEIGEGLVGQTYLEKESMYITEVPADYIQITSGLGEARPGCILIVPLKNNNEVEGVIEIASFEIFEPHEISFVEKLAENIAAALSNIRTTEMTRRLLNESQVQAEQLRSQEEEMRQNMEELSSTQEQMSMKETEYINMITKLKESLSKYEKVEK